MYILYFRNSKKKATSSSNFKNSNILETIPVDLHAATFLDVAVLRCLFVPQWCEEGVYWALQFFYHRFVTGSNNYYKFFKLRLYYNRNIQSLIVNNKLHKIILSTMY